MKTDNECRGHLLTPSNPTAWINNYIMVLILFIEKIFKDPDSVGTYLERRTGVGENEANSAICLTWVKKWYPLALLKSSQMMGGLLGLKSKPVN